MLYSPEFVCRRVPADPTDPKAFEPGSETRRPSGRVRALGAKVKSPQQLIFCRNSGVETQLQILHAASAPLYDDKEEKPHGACKKDHFQRETGDAEAAIGGISP
jgi:hypothetical protein